MQRARLKLNKNFTFNNVVFFQKATLTGEDKNFDEEAIYFAFFDDSEVALYDKNSKFFVKLNTDDLEKLIEDGSVQIVP